MKWNKSIILWLMIALPLSLLGEEKTYTLDDCIIKALNHNPSIKKYRYFIDQMEYQLKGIKSSFYPTIKVSGGYSHSYSDTSGTAADDSYSVSLNLNELLFNGLQRWNNYQIGKLEKDKARENYINSRQNIIYQVKENYFRINLYYKQIELYKKIIERRDQDLALIKLKYDSGKEKYSSVRDMQANLEESKYNLNEKQEQVRITKIKLSFLMFTNIREDFNIAPVKDNFRELNYDEIINRVKDENPDLNVSRLELKINEYNLKSTWGDYFPEINLTGSYGFHGDTFFPGDKSWNIGLSFSIPLFSGFSTSHKIKETEYRIKASQQSIQEIENDLSMEMFNALSDYHLLQKKQQVLDVKYNAAYKSYKLINLEYRQGLTSFDWLQQKENELSNLELEQEQLAYNLRVALANIEKYLIGETK